MARLSKEIVENPLKNPTQAKIIYFLAGDKGNSNTISKELGTSQTSTYDNLKILEQKGFVMKEGKYYYLVIEKMVSCVVEILEKLIKEEIQDNENLTLIVERVDERFKEQIMKWRSLLTDLTKFKDLIVKNKFIHLILGEEISFAKDFTLEETFERFILFFGNTKKEYLPQEESILAFYDSCENNSQQYSFNMGIQIAKSNYEKSTD